MDIYKWLDDEPRLDAIFPLHRTIELGSIDEHGEQKQIEYMKRWLVQKLPNGEGIYLHKIMQPDDPASGFHDHPWEWSRATILRNGYLECIFTGFGPGGLPASTRARYPLA